LMLSRIPGTFRTGLMALFRVKFPEEKVMMRKGLSVSVTVAAILLAVTTVQQAHAQGKKGGGGGMGMMRPPGVSPVSYIGYGSVQKELGLNEEKVEKLKDIANDVREEMTEQITGAGIDFRSLRELKGDELQKRRAEIQTKMAEISKTINDKFLPKVGEILDKTQMSRLHEIALQAAGPEALKDTGVVKDLALTKDQEDKLASIDKDFSAKQQSIPREERMAKMHELREEQTAKMTEVLTKEQQAKFTEMKGKPFDIKSLNQPRGRRRARAEETR
jgi:Spy/CpxP family protein refolding chaperone